MSDETPITNSAKIAAYGRVQRRSQAIRVVFQRQGCHAHAPELERLA